VLSALAFLAFVLALLRPFCDVALAATGPERPTHAAAGVTRIQDIHDDAHQHDLPGPDCCTSVEDWTPVPPLSVPAAWASGETPDAEPLLPRSHPPRAVAREAATVALPPPPERSYYARSARIQR
jgi:hypothetical protein